MESVAPSRFFFHQKFSRDASNLFGDGKRGVPALIFYRIYTPPISYESPFIKTDKHKGEGER